MPDWVNGAFIPIILALIGFIGVYLTWLVNRRNADRTYIIALEARRDKVDRRFIRLFNFAVRQQKRINSEPGPPAEDLPDDLFD